VENKFFAVVAAPGAKALAYVSKPLGTRVPIYLAGTDGAAAPLGNARVEILKKNDVRIAISAGGAEGAIVLDGAKRVVEVIPGNGTGFVGVRVDARFAFIPDFFGGDDVVFDPALFSRDSLPVPADDCLVTVQEGGRGGVMLLWGDANPNKEEDQKFLRMKGDVVSLVAAGEGAARRFTEFRVRPGTKTSAFVAVLEDPNGYFHYENLSKTRLVYDKKTDDNDPPEKMYSVVSFGWKPPFAAQWHTVLVKKPEDGIVRTKTWPLWHRKGPRRVHNELYGNHQHPSGVKSGRWTMHLERRFGPYALALNVPKVRTKRTPSDKVVLDEVFKQAIGVGPCVAETDKKGAKKKQAFCAGSDSILKYAEEGDGELFLEYSKRIYNCAESKLAEVARYRTAAAQVRKAAAALSPAAAADQKLVTRLKKYADELEESWDTSNKLLRARLKKDKEKTYKVPFKAWDFLTEEELARLELGLAFFAKIHDFDKQLLEKYNKDFKTLAKIYDSARLQWKHPGRSMDAVALKTRVLIRQIRQDASFSVTDDPAVKKLVKEVRKLTEDALTPPKKKKK